MDNATSQVKPPLHAARQGADRIVGAIAKPDYIERLHTGVARIPPQAMNSGEQFQIL